jgi:hypothetical protein
MQCYRYGSKFNSILKQSLKHQFSWMLKYNIIIIRNLLKYIVIVRNLQTSGITLLPISDRLDLSLICAGCL